MALPILRDNPSGTRPARPTRAPLRRSPLELKERTITDADTTPAVQTRVARFVSSHTERMGNADEAPEREFSFGEFLDIINPLQ